MKFFALLRMTIDRMIEIVIRAFLLARIKRRYGICLRKRLQPLLAHVKTTVRLNAPQEVNDLTSYRLSNLTSLFR